MVAYVVQNGEEYDQKFFVKVYLSFFVDGIQVHWMVVLYDGSGCSYGTGPVYFIITGMQVSLNEEEKTSVILIELNKRK